MRRLLPLVALILALTWPGRAEAAFALVQSNCATGNSVSTIQVTLGGAPSTNNLLVMSSRTFSTNRDVSSVTDSGGGETWVEIADVSDTVETFGRIHVWGTVVVSGNAVIDTNYSGSLGGDGWVCISEYTGVNTADINDDAAVSTVTATASSFPSGTLTTTNAESLLIGVALTNGGITPVQDGAFSNFSGASTTDGIMGYRIVSSTAGYQYTPTSGGTGDGFSLIAAFEGTGGGGGGSTPRLLLLGVGAN